MMKSVTKKHTSFGAKRKFVFVVGAKIGPTCTTKNTKRLIVWFDMKKLFSGRLKIENFCRQ
jgi:hypothetical protein